MPADLLVAFAVTSFLIAASPGPIVLYAVQTAMQRGLAAVWIVAPAVLLGDASVMAMSLAGVGALLASTPAMRAPLQLIGAAVLILIGAHALRFAGRASAAQGSPVGRFVESYLLAAVHPGALVFYVAFFPQFIDPARPVGIQFALLGVTFLGIAGLSILMWMTLAASAVRLTDNANVASMFRRVAAFVMLAVGVGGLISSLRP